MGQGDENRLSCKIEEHRNYAILNVGHAQATQSAPRNSSFVTNILLYEWSPCLSHAMHSDGAKNYKWLAQRQFYINKSIPYSYIIPAYPLFVYGMERKYDTHIDVDALDVGRAQAYFIQSLWIS